MKSLIITVFLACFWLGCTSKNENPEEAVTGASPGVADAVSFSALERKNAGIETGNPRIEKTGETLLLQGTVEAPPQNTVSLSFPLGGYIKSTRMIPGKAIRKGETLAIIEDMQLVQLQQDYLTAKANYALAESEFIRQRELNTSKATSDKVFQLAKAEMERQQILVKSLAEKLKVIGIHPDALTIAGVSKSLPIVSPIDGFVTKVNVAIGKYTSPTDVLFELVNPGQVHLTLRVFEKDLPNIVPGGKVVAYSNGNPEKTFEARIHLINRTLDANRMAEIHCDFLRSDRTLMPGMYMNGEVSLAGIHALTVPEDAIVRWENKHYVFAEQTDNSFKMEEVNVGPARGGRQRIEGEGLSEKTNLVIRNAFTLLMKIKNSEEAD